MVKRKKISPAFKTRLAKAKAVARSLALRLAVTSRGAKGRGAKIAPVVVPPKKVRIPRKYRPIYEALVRLRERITGQINFLATDNLTRTENDAEVDFRSKEQGTDNFDRDLALNRVSSDQDIIFEIDEALNRIQIGTYGICESCKRSIERRRMAALPYSRMCVACQSKSETGRKRQQTLEAGTLFPNIDKVAAEASHEDE